MPDFEQYIGIDWSGAEGPKLPGLRVASCDPGLDVSHIVASSDGVTWKRKTVVEWLVRKAKKARILVGLDFAFAFPFCDQDAYFPGHSDSPGSVRDLWKTVDRICSGAPDLYGGPFYKEQTSLFSQYLCYQKYTGSNFDNSRLRVTEQVCRDTRTRPSCVFKFVGRDSVGVGSVSGMRMLNKISNNYSELFSIWPFDTVEKKKSVIVEIFPRLYFHLANEDPEKWNEHKVLNRAINFFDAKPLLLTQYPATEDDADAIISAVALRKLSEQDENWQPAGLIQPAKSLEGWIFGVCAR